MVLFSSLFGFDCCCQTQEEEGSDALPQCVALKTSTREGNAELWTAAEDGDAATVARLVSERGVDVNAIDGSSTPTSRGSTALIKAARAGHADVIRALAQHPSIDMNASTRDEVRPPRSRQTALHWAAREGHAEATSALLESPFIDPNLKTQLGFSALMIAGQSGFVDVLRPMTDDARVDLNYYWLTPETIELSALMVGCIEGHSAVVKHFAQLTREDRPDINVLYRSVKCRNTLLHFGTEQMNPPIVEVLLQAKANPDIPNEHGRRPLESAIEADSTEIVLMLLAAGANSDTCFSPLRRAQIDGHGQELKKLYLRNPAEFSESQNPAEFSESRNGRYVPKLHRAVLENDTAKLAAAIGSESKTGKKIMKIVDGGHMPAAYWAIELGQWEQVRVLLQHHGMSSDFVESLLAGKFGKISSGPSLEPGERTFEVFEALLADEAKVVSNHTLAEGAFALLKPFCGSVVALSYFNKNSEDFHTLREICRTQIVKIYSTIDKEVSTETLIEIGKVAKGEPTGHCRQDDDGMLPELRYYIDEEKKQTMGGNTELWAAKTLAIAALAANEIFMEDMRALSSEVGAKLSEAPPKNYTRMFNKLMNPDEHGDPTIPKPRPMRNIDVIRVGMVVNEAQDVEKAFNAIKASHKILRVKNNHDPTGGQGFGGYRNLLVNFAYDTGIKIKDLFGEGYYGIDRDGSERDHHALPGVAEKWFRYCETMTPPSDWMWGMQALWRAGRMDPERRLVIAGEAQIILAPYMKGRALSHLLYKVSRCETGPSEMARDFAAGFQEKTPEMEEAVKTVAAIASELRRKSAK